MTIIASVALLFASLLMFIPHANEAGQKDNLQAGISVAVGAQTLFENYTCQRVATCESQETVQNPALPFRTELVVEAAFPEVDFTRSSITAEANLPPPKA